MGKYHVSVDSGGSKIKAVLYDGDTVVGGGTIR